MARKRISANFRSDASSLRILAYAGTGVVTLPGG
jgi:hypothetical protein